MKFLGSVTRFFKKLDIKKIKTKVTNWLSKLFKVPKIIYKSSIKTLSIVFKFLNSLPWWLKALSICIIMTKKDKILETSKTYFKILKNFAISRKIIEKIINNKGYRYVVTLLSKLSYAFWITMTNFVKSGISTINDFFNNKIPCGKKMISVFNFVKNFIIRAISLTIYGMKILKNDVITPIIKRLAIISKKLFTSIKGKITHNKSLPATI